MENIYGIKDEGKWKICGKKDMRFLSKIPTIIFNCAPTDISITEPRQCLEG
jgi:hypothetical protein